LNFSAANDVKAFGFVSEFLESIPGFIIVTDFEIKKVKVYSNQDLIDISTGKGKGNVTGKLDFFWYVGKSKEEAPKEKKDSSKPQEVISAQKPAN
jgi:hypothetical protein